MSNNEINNYDEEALKKKEWCIALANYLKQREAYKRYLKLQIKSVRFTLRDRKIGNLDERTFKENVWCSSVGKFIKESQASYLNLKSAHVGDNHFRLISKFFKHSRITDINLEDNELDKGIKDLIKILISHQIKKLNISRNNFSKKNLLSLFTNLKSTQLVDLNISSSYIEIDKSDVEILMSGLSQSSLTHFNCEDNTFKPDSLPVLAQGLQSTSITCLNLKSCQLGSNGITLLSRILKNTVITDLNVSDNEISSGFTVLCSNLPNSKIEKLDVSSNSINDEGIEALTQILPRTKLIELNLSKNDIIKGLDTLGESLPNSLIRKLNLSFNNIGENEILTFFENLQVSQIESLELSSCNIGDENGKKIANCLKFSKLTKLDLSGNNLSPSSILEFTETLKHSEIIDINFSQNDLRDTGVVALGQCLKSTKIKFVDVGSKFKHPVPDGALVQFLLSTCGTSLISLKIFVNELLSFAIGAISPFWENSKISHLDLHCHRMEKRNQLLLSNLRHTLITHLNLSNNKLEDGSVLHIATCLKDTQIIDLDLSRNEIGSPGVKALAKSLKDSKVIFLKLDENMIEDDGLEVLALLIEGTFVTVLDAKNNPGQKTILIDNFLWRNRKRVQLLINTFKKLVPGGKKNDLSFNPMIDNANLSNFFDNCLLLSKTVMEQPTFINHLLQEEDVSFTKTQIKSFMGSQFSETLSSFIASRVEANVGQHVSFLLKFEELGLNNLVEHLLLHRPIYIIDKKQEILHPFVYKLLHKYEQPLYNLNIEPQGKEKIFNYFKNHANMEGASDVINILKD